MSTEGSMGLAIRGHYKIPSTPRASWVSPHGTIKKAYWCYGEKERNRGGDEGRGVTVRKYRLRLLRVVRK